MHSTPRHIIRVDPATVIIFSVLLSPALITGSFLLWRGQQIADGLGLCAAYVAFLYWICSPSVELAPNELIYRSLLQRKAIMLSDVTGVSISARPAPTLELKRGPGKGPRFSFIVKPFSKSGVVALLHHVRTFAPEASFDGIARDMSAGDFKTVTRETISTQNLIRIAFAIGASSVAAALARALFHR